MEATEALDRFRSFLASARRLQGRERERAPTEVRAAVAEAAWGAPVSPSTVSAFRAFVGRARRLTEVAVSPPAPCAAGAIEPGEPSPRPGVPRESLERFASFAERARPLAVGDARRTLAVLAPLAPKVALWVTEPSVLGIAGIGLLEVPFTRLLAWALSPPGHPAVALVCQNALLSHLGLAMTSGPLAVEEQVVTGDGIPDLVLRGDHHLLVIEAKTGTCEHVTPSGVPQTIAYSRQLLEPAVQTTRALLFLTLDGDEAASAEAIRCTWLAVSLCLAEALASVELEAGLRAAYAAILSHWLLVATPHRLDVLSVLRRAPDLMVASEPRVLARALRGLAAFHRC